MQPSTRPASDAFVLKRNDAFVVLDEFGDVRSDLFPDQGLYLNDCRHVSRLQLRLGGVPPLLLAGNLDHDGALLHVDLTNSDAFGIGDQAPASRETVHVLRHVFLWDDVLFQRLELRSYAREPQLLMLQQIFDADFLDMFEIRGQSRHGRGSADSAVENGRIVRMRYDGLDGVHRETVVCTDPAPATLSPHSATHRLLLEPGRVYTLHTRISAGHGGANRGSGEPADLVRSYRRLRRRQREHRRRSPEIRTSNELFNAWIDRSVSDLHMLLADREHGLYPHAGTPWFNTEFGRDGILTAYESLLFEPAIAAGVLRFLAATQAQDFDAYRDAAPGKILHERRYGEMARLREVPFAQYYGSVDATPLFVMLAGAYLKRTDDDALLEDIWPQIRRAIAWLDEHGDTDGDGFVEYERESETGLRNQGWKDSDDSVSHADGGLAGGAIALCEVQAYTYAARRAAAEIARRRGDASAAAASDAEAERLAQQFDEQFWDDRLEAYVLALDGEKRPCRVVSSNAGHALLAGIVHPSRVSSLVARLMSADMWSGWGIRTLGEREIQYSPLSYHNGSVWPHDNALVAMGMARAGFRREPLRVMTGLFDASLHMNDQRLPELFCGFPRRRGGGPVEYAEACAPQAWSSAALYGLLSAVLGLSVDAAGRRVRVERPMLPGYIATLEIRGLAVGGGHVDLRFESNHQGLTSTIPLAVEGDVEITIRP